MNRSLRALAVPLLFAFGAASLGRAQDLEYFSIALDGAQQVPPVVTTATGVGCAVLDLGTNVLSYYYEFSALSSPQTEAHIHGFIPPSTLVLIGVGVGSPNSGSVTLTPAQSTLVHNSLAYINVHSELYLNGEIRGQIVRQTLPPLANHCFGDGSGTACPCGNEETAGVAAGCRNGNGVGAFLRGRGIPSVHRERFELVAGNLPASGTVMFLQGTARAAGGAGSVFGDGLRCVAGTVIRLGAARAAAGVAVREQPGEVGAATVGATLYYQAWYRNSAPFCTPAGFNTSDALEVVWLY